jgi:transcriptional regulator with XRE-family HTH domain
MTSISDSGKKRLGERIRKARLDADLTQGQLATRIGISQNAVSNVETGLSTIDAPDLVVWAQALDKPVMYFLLDGELTALDRAAAILSMFPEDRLEFVSQMLESLALTMQQQKQGS